MKKKFTDLFASNRKETASDAGHTCCFQAQEQGYCAAQNYEVVEDHLVVKLTDSKEVIITSEESKKISDLLAERGIIEEQVTSIDVTCLRSSYEGPCCFW
jgi:flagellar biosynthesis component FlhA